MKTIYILLIIAASTCLSGCNDVSLVEGYNTETRENNSLRFELTFNHTAVDFDLFVSKPDGTIDVAYETSNCGCVSCPNGGETLLYNAPQQGVYTYGVVYYTSDETCNNNTSANYTLEIYHNDALVATQSGTLSTANTGDSFNYTY